MRRESTASLGPSGVTLCVVLTSAVAWSGVEAAPPAAFPVPPAATNAAATNAAATNAADPRSAAFFEARIRPILVDACGKCHAAALASPKGGLVLDTRAGLRKGGRDGAVIVPGKAEESRLLKAIRYTDPDSEMPPAGKLPDRVIADFERWIAAGAVDPRAEAPAAASKPTGMSIESGRAWWAFQPLRPATPTRGDLAATPKRIDAFLQAARAEKQLAPSPPADRATLAARVYVDLVGYKPTFEEVRAFVADRAPRAFERLVERLLASPAYGERWARRWMDVARYGEDNPTSEATNPPYRFAWRYRDWIIEALNADLPYPRFVQLQLAADLLPGTSRSDLRALGFLGAGPVYHKDQRLSADIIGGFATDDWDERIDAVTRGVLGLSVACARCHDHKFDPITQRDYYALMGVFASTTRAERPLAEVPRALEVRYLALQRRLVDLRYSLNLVANETSTFTDVPGKQARWGAEVERLKLEATGLLAGRADLLASLERLWTPPAKPEEPVVAANVAGKAQEAPNTATGPRRRRPPPEGSTEPFTEAVFDAATYIDASDPTYTFLVYKPGEARDMPFLRGGNYASQGEPVPRALPAVLAEGDARLGGAGSGRRQLAERLFADAAPLAARVIVNRVWGWHFGKPLVATASDFGTQGDRPTHPALLDDLAARFVANGWSQKWLHREILGSAAYQQASRPRPEALAVDPDNTLLWRMNPQRLDVESYRDSLLRAAGALDTTMGGVSGELEGETFFRRSIYGRVSRGRPSALLALFDFPAAVQSAPGRDQTLTSLQQIYMLNNPFLRTLAARVVSAAPPQAGPARQVEHLYRRVLARDPLPGERAAGLAYLRGDAAAGRAPGTQERLALILLGTNELLLQP